MLNEPTVWELVMRSIISAIALFVLLGLGYIIIGYFLGIKEKGGDE